MTLFEFSAAVLIAFYAMLGGVFLSAAITAPRNCDTLLRAGRKTILGFIVYGLFFMGGVLALAYLRGPTFALLGHPFTWLSVAHLLLYATFWACGRIVRILLEFVEPGQDGQKKQIGPDGA